MREDGGYGKPDDAMQDNYAWVTPTFKPVFLRVNIGIEAQDFSVGDYLNAINEVTCHFQGTRQIDDDSIASALRLYAQCVDDA